MRTLAAIATTLLLTGCATTPPARYMWFHPGVTDAQARADHMSCEQYAAAVAPYSHLATGHQRSSFDAIMFGERRAQYAAAGAECMRMKGYQWVAVP